MHTVLELVVAGPRQLAGVQVSCHFKGAAHILTISLQDSLLDYSEIMEAEVFYLSDLTEEVAWLRIRLRFLQLEGENATIGVYNTDPLAI